MEIIPIAFIILCAWLWAVGTAVNIEKDDYRRGKHKRTLENIKRLEQELGIYDDLPLPWWEVDAPRLESRTKVQIIRDPYEAIINKLGR